MTEKPVKKKGLTKQDREERRKFIEERTLKGWDISDIMVSYDKTFGTRYAKKTIRGVYYR